MTTAILIIVGGAGILALAGLLIIAIALPAAPEGLETEHGFIAVRSRSLKAAPPKQPIVLDHHATA